LVARAADGDEILLDHAVVAMLGHGVPQEGRALLGELACDAGGGAGDPARAFDHLLAMVDEQGFVVVETELAAIELVDQRRRIDRDGEIGRDPGETTQHGLRAFVHHTTSSSMKPLSERPLSGTWQRIFWLFLSFPD